MIKNKVALLTGITGQVYYLAKLLLEKDYVVHGTIRRSSLINTLRIDSLISKYQPTGKLVLHYSDLLDSSSLNSLIVKIVPDEIYNLAAQSHVSVSFKNPIYYSNKYSRWTISITAKHSNKEIKFIKLHLLKCMAEEPSKVK